MRDMLGELPDDDEDDDIKIVDLDDLPDPREPVKRGKYHKSTDAAVSDVLSGVTMRWFQLVFDCDLRTVKKAVVGIKPVRISNGGAKFYAIKDVAPRLLKPEVPIEEYLNNITPDQLPEKLRESYWNVQAKSQKVRAIAGELWKTTDVIEVLGETFKHIKNTIMLWTDTIEEQAGLSDEQRKIVITLGDALQHDIHQTVIKRAQESATRSQLKEVDGDADF